jgi:pimeloyl-ACP methyl ester carboxylesterase
MPFLELGETRIHYRLDGAGEPLVLVHGSWIDGRVWDAVFPTLAQSFQVVAYDRRGHSRSSGPPGQGSIREDVEDLVALIDRLGIAPANVAGVSWGGSIALRLAAARPELVRSLAVHEPPLFDLVDSEEVGGRDLTELRGQLATVAERLESGDDAGAAQHYFDRVASTGGGWGGLDEAGRRIRLANAATYLDQCGDPEALGIDLESLRAFSGPALVTYGDRRPPFFKRIVEMVVAALPGAVAEELPGTAHDPQVTHPDLYARVLRDFAIVTAMEYG